MTHHLPFMHRICGRSAASSPIGVRAVACFIACLIAITTVLISAPAHAFTVSVDVNKVCPRGPSKAHVTFAVNRQVRGGSAATIAAVNLSCVPGTYDTPAGLGGLEMQLARQLGADIDDVSIISIILTK
ncbi:MULTISPECIES: hypothetical protein [unclassified Burkholderia]|uniref:hypothetical protein n=1 Tax=unclassified Burkholderia TaxID=2613784 RepID=UPI002AB27ED3|nr:MULTISPECIES: hypothetical protein [unclassified Burkholderia]